MRTRPRKKLTSEMISGLAELYGTHRAVAKALGISERLWAYYKSSMEAPERAVFHIEDHLKSNGFELKHAS